MTDISTLIGFIFPTILGLFILSLGGVGLGLSIASLYLIFLTRSNLNKEQAEFRKTTPHEADKVKELNRFLVGWASEDKFKNWHKISVVQGLGWLLVEENKVTFQSNYLFWSNLEFPIDPEEADIKWVGRVLINGYGEWFSMNHQGRKIYLTADFNKTAFDVLNGNLMTKNLYKMVSRSL